MRTKFNLVAFRLSFNVVFALIEDVAKYAILLKVCVLSTWAVLVLMRVIRFDTKVIFSLLLWFTDQQSTLTPSRTPSKREGSSPPAGKQTSLPSTPFLPSTGLPTTRKPIFSTRPVLHALGTKPGNTEWKRICEC